MSENNGLLVLSRKAITSQTPLETLVFTDEDGNWLGSICVVKANNGRSRIGLKMREDVKVLRGEIAVIHPDDVPINEETNEPEFVGLGMSESLAGIQIKPKSSKKKLKVVATEAPVAIKAAS